MKTLITFLRFQYKKLKTNTINLQHHNKPTSLSSGFKFTKQG